MSKTLNFSPIYKLDIFREMTDAEQSLALRKLAQAIKEKPSTFAITHSDPIKENCYTSSSSLAGIYFPNSVVRIAGWESYDVVALCESEDDQICLVLTLNPKGAERAKKFPSLCQSDYVAVNIDCLIYDREEMEIREKISSYLLENQNKLHALKTLKRATKKDGKPFANIAQNYPDSLTLVRGWTGTVDKLHIAGQGVKGNFVSFDIWLFSDDRTENPTFEIVENTIKCEIARLEKDIVSYKKQLGALHKAYVKCRSAIAKANEILQSVPEAKGEHFLTTLGYSLRDYMKGALD